MRNTVTLEMTIGEYKIIEDALRNYKERLSYLQEKNEGNFERYQSLKDQEKKLEKIINELGK